MRVEVRAYPNAPRTVVGGRYGTDDPAVLIVRVSAPAVDGRANQAVIAAVARAFGVRRHAVTLLSGAAHRYKILDVAGADPATLAALLSA
ncbi:MAG TPA: DUF167 domain-containing protein [Acidimicrobiales bacterium]|nr:DUF167 domain-containing protein [Acidimicrobiales bacterium]